MKKSKPKKKTVTETGWAVWQVNVSPCEQLTNIECKAEFAWETFERNYPHHSEKNEQERLEAGYRCLRTTAKGEI